MAIWSLCNDNHTAKHISMVSLREGVNRFLVHNGYAALAEPDANDLGRMAVHLEALAKIPPNPVKPRRRIAIAMLALSDRHGHALPRMYDKARLRTMRGLP